MTNQEFVEELMTVSPYGLLSQLFILEAIRKYSEQVAAADPKIFEGHCQAGDPQQFVGHFIHGPAWQGVADDILRRIESHLNQ
jgi:hypothetical protein